VCIAVVARITGFTVAMQAVNVRYGFVILSDMFWHLQWNERSHISHWMPISLQVTRFAHIPHFTDFPSSSFTEIFLHMLTSNSFNLSNNALTIPYTVCTDRRLKRTYLEMRYRTWTFFATISYM